jgi:hypothetical protein
VRIGAAFLIVALAVLAGGARASVESPPQVTVIGDSVLTALEWNAEPLAVLRQGLDLRLDVGICRTLTGVSCPFEDHRAPTLVDVVNTLGPELGDVVLVEVGYNDDHGTFAASVEQSVSALLRAGVKHILWANLHGFTQQWLDMNDVLEAAARRHPELTVIDWNDYAGTHWSWFQGDSIHLVHEGAMAMATLFRRAIDQIVDPVVIQAAQLPVARVGQAYAARSAAEGPQPPPGRQHRRRAPACRTHPGRRCGLRRNGPDRDLPGDAEGGPEGLGEGSGRRLVLRPRCREHALSVPWHSAADPHQHLLRARGAAVLRVFADDVPDDACICGAEHFVQCGMHRVVEPRHAVRRPHVGVRAADRREHLLGGAVEDVEAVPAQP